MLFSLRKEGTVTMGMNLENTRSSERNQTQGNCIISWLYGVKTVRLIGRMQRPGRRRRETLQDGRVQGSEYV